MIESVAIVGASLAGTRAADALRDFGFDGRILLIGDEAFLPYQRPPLSKDYLSGGGDEALILLRDERWYEDQRIELLLRNRVTDLDPATMQLRLSSGSVVQADRILIATGARPRPLSAAEGAQNVHVLRTREDSRALGAALKSGSRLLVIGMGVIGSEVAATAIKQGVSVAAVEPAALPMARTLGTAAGRWLAHIQRERGVEMHLLARPERIEMEGDRVTAVILDNGKRLECDTVLVGIGVNPADELAAEAGIEISNGVLVDERCATSAPGIFAAGDVANVPAFSGGRVRLETFQNAAGQAEAAARAMLGLAADCRQPCSFWSDQYEFNIQICGRVDDQLRIVQRGHLEEGAFTFFYLEEGVLAGVLSVNRPADIAIAKRMIAARRAVDANALADSSVPLRCLIAPPPQR